MMTKKRRKEEMKERDKEKERRNVWNEKEPMEQGRQKVEGREKKGGG